MASTVIQPTVNHSSRKASRMSACRSPGCPPQNQRRRRTALVGADAHPTPRMTADGVYWPERSSACRDKGAQQPSAVLLVARRAP
jgi:hypothetical protein